MFVWFSRWTNGQRQTHIDLGLAIKTAVLGFDSSPQV